MTLKQLTILALQASIFGTVLSIGLSATAADLAYLVRRPGLLVRSVAAVLVIMPLVTLVMVGLLDFPQPVETVLVALAISPVPPILPTKETRAGGNVPYAIGLMAVLALLSIAAIPFTIGLLANALGRPFAVSPGTIAKTALISTLVPLVAGVLIHSAAPAAARRIARPVSRFSLVLLLAGAVVMFAAASSSMLALIGGGTLLAMVVFTIGGLVIGHVLGRPDQSHSTVLALSTACRHPAIALGVAASLFPDQQFGPMVLLFMIVNAIVAIPYVKRQRRLLASAAALVLAIAAVGCGGSSPAPAGGGAASTEAAPPLPADPKEPIADTPSPYEGLSEEMRVLLDKPFTGDLDEMVKRRVVRAGVVYSRTHYFIDKGVQRGIAYESVNLFEEELNKRLKTGTLKVHIAIVPLSRDQLFPALRDGKVDFAAASLTITPERRKIADFSNPVRSNVSEVVVTAADVPPVATADDLSGREVFVRKSSAYYENLQALNASLAKRNKPPVVFKEAPEALEDDDILEMVNAGLVDVTVVDDFVAEFWQKVFPNFKVQAGATVATGGEIAIAVRKNNPKMQKAANTFIKEYGRGTAFGNTVERRYLESTKYVKNAASDAERKKLEAMVQMFKKYGDQYDVDYLLMAAQGYQESRLDQEAKSHVGAIGVMQVMPATGKDLKVGDINMTEPNIHAGVKYFRFMMNTFYKDEPMDTLNKGLMTLASYNAGPGRMRQLRAETKKRGLDPNLWFNNVERIVSERIGRETVTYVSNIYKYYVAYKLVMERREARAAARGSVGR